MQAIPSFVKEQAAQLLPDFPRLISRSTALMALSLSMGCSKTNPWRFSVPLRLRGEL